MSQPINSNLTDWQLTLILCLSPFLFAIVLCCGINLCCCLCTRVALSRSRPRNLRGLNYPPDIGSVGQRRLSGEQPRIWDISTASRFPSRSEPGPQSEKPGISQGQGEGEEHDVSRAADDGEGTEWTEFLVSCVCSLHQSLSVAAHFGCSCLFSWISSHYLQTRC